MSTLTQVKIDQVLIGDSCFYCHLLEILNHINPETQRNLLFEGIGVRIPPPVRDAKRREAGKFDFGL